MSIMNMLSITLVALIICTMLALFLGVQAASAQAAAAPADTRLSIAAL